MALAQEILAQLEKGTNNYTPLYDLDLSIKEKIEKIAKEIYGADGVEFVGTAKKMLKIIDDLGYGKLPVCMSKTQKSLSDNAALLGRPTGFTVSNQKN